MLDAPQAEGHTFTQKNFHGLWWAERTWTGDILGLKIGQNAIARDSAPHILAPSLAGPNLLLHSAQNGDDLDAKNLEGPKAPSELDEGGSYANACYKLTDIDWVDPSEEAAKRPTSTLLATDGAISHEDYHVMSNTLPQPSSLKSTVFPNPNPTIPIVETAPQMFSEILHHSSVPENEANGVYEPLISVFHYHLPQAPTGFKFCSILDPGYEVVFSLTLLSGQSYADILRHFLLMEAIHEALTLEGKVDHQTSHLWSLEGLEPGFSNSVDAIRYKTNRLRMIVD
ncbi:hypothetical protein HHX47_DHR6000501 [Lentinula edodes]|nr:hypothetical protein HHX47_DHR6000501 [Lentinula edodes]